MSGGGTGEDGGEEQYMVLVCDVQERFMPAIMASKALVSRISFILQAAKAIGVQALATEQVPEKLGSTVPEIASFLTPPETHVAPIAKKNFSMAIPDVVALLEESEVKHVVLVGLETHVCILQTAKDLSALGFEVICVADAISSRKPFDRSIALRTLSTLPKVRLSTTESIVFEMMGGADHAAFRAVQSLLKEFDASTPPTDDLCKM